MVPPKQKPAINKEMAWEEPKLLLRALASV